MMKFRNGDEVLVNGYVVSVDGENVTINISGREVDVLAEGLAVVKRSYHPGDRVLHKQEKAEIAQTLEFGVHMIRYLGSTRIGARAYDVVDESALVHDDSDEDRALAAEEKAAPVVVPATGASEVKADAPLVAVPELLGGDPPIKVTQLPVPTVTASAAPSPAPAAPAAPQVPAEDNIRNLAGALASVLEGDNGGEGHDGSVSIDLESIGVTKDYRPVNERETATA